MVEPKHKLKGIKKKTFIDKLLGSALFILLLILIALVDIIAFLVWLSKVLQSSLQGSAIFTDGSFYLFVGLAGFLVVFFVAVWAVKRAA